QNRVKLNFLVNIKSGLCPEDCSYCSQRRGSKAGVLRYSWIGAVEAAEAARAGITAGAARVCLVASGREPSERDLAHVVELVEEIRRRHPGVEVCTSLGLLRPGQASALRAAGVFAYNHNLNTSPGKYGEICTTHGFEDRCATLDRASSEGLSPCSGAILGMGETDADIVELAAELRRHRPDSVPVNFLMPFDGTPMAGRNELTPQRCLRILCCFRFYFPDAELRIAGGRELHLRSLQPLALHVANSIFLGDYLTSEGGPGKDDLAMIADGGFVLEWACTAGTFAAGVGSTGDDPGSRRPRPERSPRPRLRAAGPGTDRPARAW
ncbi:MAG TPA: biotin synthase BioB, partial [Acidimicrobiales bacterium]|nr:biotin synthase BioB [Acidimicrobiales bacterium]